MDNDYRRPGQDARVAQTRELVLRAARQLLLEAGQDAVTPTRLTDITGISRSTIYRHWKEPSDIIFEASGMPPDDSPLTPTGSTQDDVVRYLEELRMMLAGPRGTLVATQIDRAEHDPHAAESMQRIAAHRRMLISGLLLQDEDSFDLFHALLVGPLIYQRYMAREEITDELIELVANAFVAIQQELDD